MNWENVRCHYDLWASSYASGARRKRTPAPGPFHPVPLKPGGLGREAGPAALHRCICGPHRETGPAGPPSGRPVLVALDETGQVQGYAFCVLQRHQGEGSFQDMTTLYLDDLCVDEACRGRHAGRQLYDAVLALAREKGCYNVTLNVWACNAGAMRFYEGCGLQTQKIGLEVVL